MDVYVRCNTSMDQCINFPVPDSIIVFVCAYCKTQRVQLHLVTTSDTSWPVGIDFSRDILANLSHDFMEGDKVPASVQLCDLPAAVSSPGCLVHSGMCALLRGVIKTAHSEHPHDHLNELLVGIAGTLRGQGPDTFSYTRTLGQVNYYRIIIILTLVQILL